MKTTPPNNNDSIYWESVRSICIVKTLGRLGHIPSKQRIKKIDSAGQKSTKKLLSRYATVVNYSNWYSDFVNINDWLAHGKV